MSRFLAVALVAFAAPITAFAAPFRASPAGVESGAEVRIEARVDAPTLALSAALVVLPRVGVLPQQQRTGSYTAPPAPGASNGRYPLTAPSVGAARASDGVLITGIAASAIVPTLAWRGRRRAASLVIMTEVLTLNYGINSMVKAATGAPRPMFRRHPDYAPGVDISALRWDEQTLGWGWSDAKYARWSRHAQHEIDTGDAWQSFYSGHTSTVAASVSGLTWLAAAQGRRRGLSADTWGAWWSRFGLSLGAGVLAGEAQGRLRMLAWKHHVRDVHTGSWVGAALGTLIPALHTLPRRGARAEARRMAVRPVVSASHLGLSGRW